MTRRTAAAWLAGVAIVAAVVAVVVFGPIERGEGFHRYADQRTWLGIPHAGDVLSNLAFLVVAWWYLRRAPAISLAVAWIGVGSAIYHWGPSDLTLALDWAPIGVTLMLVLAEVIRDRIGPRAGHVVQGFGPMIAVATVGYWLVTGGTGFTGGFPALDHDLSTVVTGGNMAPYVALQVLGVALSPLLALVAPGRISARYLVAAVVCFGVARVLGANDAAILDAIAISGHSLKHLAAAAAAACVLRACS